MKITKRLACLSAAPLLLLPLLLPGCSSATGNDPDALALQILDQTELEQAVLPRGDEKAVVLNFWATWCGPCIAEMPTLVELHEEWKPKGIRVQTIALDVQIPQGNVKTAKDVAAFMERKGYDIPVIVPSAQGLSGLTRKFGLSGAIPVTLVIDKSGEIVARHEGGGNRKLFERMAKRAGAL